MKLWPCRSSTSPVGKGPTDTPSFPDPMPPPASPARATRVSKGRLRALPDSPWSRGILTAETSGLVKELRVPGLLRLLLGRLRHRLGGLLWWSFCLGLPVSIGLTVIFRQLLQAKQTTQTAEHLARGAAAAVPVTRDPSCDAFATRVSGGDGRKCDPRVAFYPSPRLYGNANAGRACVTTGRRPRPRPCLFR